MSTEDDGDIIESWIEVTPQALGYHPTGGHDSTVLDVGIFHTSMEEQLLNRLLSEAQDHSDRASEVAPRSPPPSRDVVTPDHGLSQPLPPAAVLYAAAVKASALGSTVTTENAEWPSRPEVGGFLVATEPSDQRAGSSPTTDPTEKSQSAPWSLRNSSLMKSPVVVWIVDHIPCFLSHAATFLLGAATMFVVLRKRVDWSRVLRHLPPVD